MNKEAHSLDTFLAQGRSVCPFAVRSNRIYAASDIEPRLDRAILRSATGAFAKTMGQTPNAALLVLRRHTETKMYRHHDACAKSHNSVHACTAPILCAGMNANRVREFEFGFEDTKTWALEVFLELMMCFGLNAGVNENELTPAIDQVRTMMLDRYEPRRPMLGCGNEPLYAICMAPLYPTTHPRYAPRAVVIVTWQADVAAVRDRPARAHIHKAMAREHGFVYDADELMLPLPGRYARP